MIAPVLPPGTSARRFSIVAVPTSAGSHNAGQELAPAAWLDAGLVDGLRAHGHDVTDAVRLPVRPHRAVDRVDGARDLDRVREIALATAIAVREVGNDRIPLVVGGDCTITLGAVAGLAAVGPIGLLYFDGDVDLNTPERSASGVLDTMGMTHLLGGGLAALGGIGARTPLIADEHVELFGFDPAELDQHQWTQIAARRLSATPAESVRADPATAARAAVERLAAKVDRIVVHFDVDVLDAGAFPLANFPHFGGLTLHEAALCLRVFLRRPELAALVITEVNPTHDPDGTLLARLRDAVVGALRLSSVQ